MGFSRQDYWRGLPCSPPGDHPDPGIEPMSLTSTCHAGDLRSIPGLGRSPGEGNGNPLQYSCLENPMDRGAWWATVHRVAKSWTRLSDFTFTICNGYSHSSHFPDKETEAQELKRLAQVTQPAGSRAGFPPASEVQTLAALSLLATVFMSTCYAPGTALGIAGSAANETKVPALLHVTRGWQWTSDDK